MRYRALTISTHSFSLSRPAVPHSHTQPAAAVSSRRCACAFCKFIALSLSRSPLLHFPGLSRPNLPFNHSDICPRTRASYPLTLLLVARLQHILQAFREAFTTLPSTSRLLSSTNSSFLSGLWQTRTHSGFLYGLVTAECATQSLPDGHSATVNRIPRRHSYLNGISSVRQSAKWFTLIQPYWKGRAPWRGRSPRVALQYSHQHQQ